MKIVKKKNQIKDILININRRSKRRKKKKKKRGGKTGPRVALIWERRKIETLYNSISVLYGMVFL